MQSSRLALLSFLGLSFAVVSCGKQEEVKIQAPAQAETAKTAKVEEKPAEVPAPPKETEPEPPPSPYAVTEADAGLGDFGSSEPIERENMPTRGIIELPIVQETHFTAGAHWEQYNFPFKMKRWGKYAVRLTYQLKTNALGVQLKFGNDRLKKQLTNTNGGQKRVIMGEIYIPMAGDHFMSLYTPQSVGYIHFYPKSLELIPANEGEDIKQSGDGTVALLAKDATTWSENMRYEPKPEKNCLGFWTEADDFAEWEFTVEKPGTFAVAVHQGCGGGGGSEVAVALDGQELKFKVQDTGGYQKWTSLNVGEVKIEKPGTYRLTVKPQNKQGNAVMDVQKIILAPVS